MKYRAILFDMDGTLLPMDMNTFTGGYFKLLAAKLQPYGVEPEVLIKAVWGGVAAMVKNDGSCTNEEAFWKFFVPATGLAREIAEPVCLEFYGKEFQEAKRFTAENPLAKTAVELAREKAELVVLATNPLFPMVGQETRMGWVGLRPEEFDLVTSFESDRFCKPNPEYFRTVCERIGAAPEECLLIGNDEREDMISGTQAGLSCWLVTDTAIPCPEHPWNGPKGTFAELVELLRSL